MRFGVGVQDLGLRVSRAFLTRPLRRGAGDSPSLAIFIYVVSLVFVYVVCLVFEYVVCLVLVHVVCLVFEYVVCLVLVHVVCLVFVNVVCLVIYDSGQVTL